MIKKFYYGLVSLKYVYFMFGIPIVIFVTAFIETRYRNPALKAVMGVCATLLAIVLFFYYRDKFRISRVLKSISNLSEYQRGGMVDRTYILEDRMLACADLDLKEISTCGIESLEKTEEKKGKPYLKLTSKDGHVMISALSDEEAGRLAAFIQKKNPEVKLSGVVPTGNGTLKELGAPE